MPIRILLLLCVLPFSLAVSQGFDDEFNGSVDARWEWLRPDPSRQLILGSQLTIITQNGALYGTQFNNMRNMLLQQAPQGAFAIETKVQFLGDSTLHSAGLLYYLDDDNFLSISKGFYLGQNVVLLLWEIAGTFTIETLPIESMSTLYLRLTRRAGGHFTGELSFDGTIWATMFSRGFPLGSDIAKIGIQASNGEGVNVTQRQIPARFDYFRVNRTVPVGRTAEAHAASVSLRVYPAPLRLGVDGILHIEARSSGAMQLLLFNAAGRCVYRWPELRFYPGTNVVALPADGLPAGAYHLVAEGKGVLATRALIIVP